MENKILALFPLLGWFYITVFILAGVRYLFPKVFKKIEWIVWLSFGVWAMVLAAQSLLDEVKLYDITKETVAKTAEEKIKLEVQSSYNIYYKTFHQYMVRGVHINIVGVSSKEYHYARMYLYPAPIEDRPDCETQLSKGCIIHESQKKRFLHYKFVGQAEDKVLLMKP